MKKNLWIKKKRDLFSFETERMRLDLIQLFRIVNSFDIGFEKYFAKCQYKSTRGYLLINKRLSYCLNIRKYSF